MFLLAHISDPHLAAMPKAKLLELAGKRALGLLNWRLRRHLEHRPEVLDAIVADLSLQSPDHVAVTGDLVNLALPGEFAVARKFLERIGPPEQVTFVPGNHDAYVRAAASAGALHWAEYLSGDPPHDRKATFPFLRRRGPLALIGLSTALPTGPFMAWGRLGEAQLDALGRMLASVRHEGLFRVVLLHHPPIRTKNDRFKQLVDADAFRHVLRQHGADLILHGHSHERSLASLDGPDGPIPLAGVPSASAIGAHDDPAAYNLFRIEQGKDGWHCEMVERGFSGANADGIHELARRTLHPRQDQ